MTRAPVLRPALLACGVLASLLYVATDLLAAIRYPDYHGFRDQMISELMATGAPTERLVDPRYYGDAAGRDAALEAIHASGCRFLVAGRVEDGIFRTLADIEIPDRFRDLFIDLPEHAFRIDLSSSEIRAWRSAGSASEDQK